MTDNKLIHLLESMGESYFESDLNGKLTLFNDNVCRFHGRTPEELKELDYHSFMRPAEAEKVFAIFNEVYRTGLPSKLFEYEIIRKDGTPATAETIVSLRRGPLEEPIGFCGISRDITDKKNIETALRRSEEKHRSILANMEEGYYEVDLTGTFTFVNAAACRNLGRERDEVIGMNYRDYMPPETVSKTFQIFNEIYRSGVPANIFQSELIRKDGVTRIHELSISPLRQTSGEIIGFSGISRDLTERLQMERSLRESEESYRRIMDLSPDTITINRADDGRYVEVNETFCRDTGYSREEIIGRTAQEVNLFVQPDDHNRLLDALRKGSLHGLELQFRAKDGTILDDLVSGCPIQFKGDSCVLFICTVITPLKKIQQALRESEESYRRVIELAPDSITVARFDDGLYYEINESFCQQTGYSREEIIGKTVFDLKIYENPDDRNRIKQILAEGGHVESMEIRFQSKTGFPLVSLVSARIIQFRGETCVLTVATLINDLKSAQQALEEREAGYRAILEMAPNSIVLIRQTDFCMVQANDAFCQKLGFSREEVLSRKPMDLNLFADSASRRKLLQALLLRGRVDGMELRFRSRNGQILDSLVYINPIRYKGDDCFLIMTVDITSRKRTEQELDRYRRHLEEMVQARTRELESAQMELIKREKLSVLGQLTATVSHELRNPLGVIRSSNFYLQRRVKDKDDKIDKHFKRIEEQITLCDAIVADLLEFTRGRNVTMVKEELAPWMEGLLMQMGENEGIDIEMEMENGLPPIPHDRDKLRRVILNVVDNAIQAVKARKMNEDLNPVVEYRPKIVLQVGKQDTCVVIQIGDNGIGMNQETLAHAFEPLFTTRARGTGIGLANVKKIVEEHGGSVHLESRLGEGSHMTIILPR